MTGRRGGNSRFPIIFRVLSLVLVCLQTVNQPALAQGQVVNIYNWTDYIDPGVLGDFSRETGIRVQYDMFDSLETLETNVLAGHSGYDIIVPSSEPSMSRLIRAGALAIIERNRVPNWKNLDPALMQRVGLSDPGNQYGVIYLWGSIGLGINSAQIKSLAPAAPLDSWSLLLDPVWAKQIAPCGIIMTDAASDLVPTVLRYLGRSPNDVSLASLDAVFHTLEAIRPYIRSFAIGGALEALATGSACLALDYSGDVVQASARAKEAGKGVAIQYVVPREGAELNFDMLAIPFDAPHKDAALTFINFMLRPDVMARITEATSYPNALPAARALMRPVLLNDPNIFPREFEMAKFFTIGPLNSATIRARTRMWSRFKAGN